MADVAVPAAFLDFLIRVDTPPIRNLMERDITHTHRTSQK
jgi:hypothetical protein